MKLNTKSRIAIKALLDLATHGEREPVSLATVAERQAVSLSYLEQLFRRLRARGFVKSARGPGGGYQLGRRLSAISVADVVNVVDSEAGKRRSGTDSIDALWAGIERELLDYLRTVPLDSLLDDKSKPRAVAHRAVLSIDFSKVRNQPPVLAAA